MNDFVKGKETKRILHSPFTLPILRGISENARPSMIAKRLKISDQLLHYHTKQLIAIGWITKEGDRNGIEWKLTEKGMFILKEFYRWGDGNGRLRFIPQRMHNVRFSFQLESPAELPNLRWKDVGNGVKKCTIDPRNSALNGTVELTSSEKGKISMQVIMHDRYFYDSFAGIIQLFIEACILADITARRVNLQLRSLGRLSGRPHVAFEQDLVAVYLASFQTAEIETRFGKAWFDSSKGIGELESDDSDYVYNYLTMPETVKNMKEELDRISKYTMGYPRYYDPCLQVNN